MRSGTDDVRISALETVGNLAFQVENRAVFLADAELLEWVNRLARDQVPPPQRPSLSSLPFAAARAAGPDQALLTLTAADSILSRRERCNTAPDSSFKT